MMQMAIDAAWDRSALTTSNSLTKETVLSAFEQATKELQPRLRELYANALHTSYFAGGWCRDPKFAKEDYDGYRQWITSHVEEAKEPKEFALIGLNKLWRLHDDLHDKLSYAAARILERKHLGESFSLQSAIVKLQLIESATITIPDGTRYSSRKKEWDRFCIGYDWKCVHIADASEDLAIRAVDTDEVSKTVPVSSVLVLLKNFHRALEECTASYSPTLFFDEERLHAVKTGQV